MNRFGFAIMLIVSEFVAIPQSHAEASTETTFSNIVKNERLRVCASSSLPTCDSDFNRPALLAEWLDTEEDRAIMIEKSGQEKAAHELRIQILSHAAMLDIWMDHIRLLHRKN
jgi:hypothetical protein